MIFVDKYYVGLVVLGCNGGQLMFGFVCWEVVDMIDYLVYDDVKWLWCFVLVELMDLIDEIGVCYVFDFDCKCGYVMVVVYFGYMSVLFDGVDVCCYFGDVGVMFVGCYQLYDEYVCLGLYYGVVIDVIGGQIYLFVLVCGFVYGFQLNGGVLYEGIEVFEFDEMFVGVVVMMLGGMIIVCCGVVFVLYNMMFWLLDDGVVIIVLFFMYVSVMVLFDVDVVMLMLVGMLVYDMQFQIDYYWLVCGNWLLFGGQGIGICWVQFDVNVYLLMWLNMVFLQYDGCFVFDYCWSGVSDFMLNGVIDSCKIDGCVLMYMVQGWSGYGVVQMVWIGKVICDDFVGCNDDFLMFMGIDYCVILFGWQLLLIVILVVKVVMSVMSVFNLGWMILF